MLYLQHFHNTSQQILSTKLLLVAIIGQKSNLSDMFKLKPITTYHIRFFVKILWT